MARVRRTERAFSAGGVVFRRAAAPHPSHAGPLCGSATPAIEIALVGRLRSDMWMLPKGTPNQGETVAEAALREVREETGLDTRIVGELGSIHYIFARAGTRFEKEVFHYLLEATGGDVSLHDEEYDEARWFPVAEARRRLSYRNEADLLAQAEPLIARLVGGQPAAPEPTTNAAAALDAPREA
ncbi:MAG TPA: NUDIX hydrolase [Ktedonobacterales bacterium]|nr:NUDIX hydrolase [Ktedonobacterales bacterium]